MLEGTWGLKTRTYIKVDFLESLTPHSICGDIQPLPILRVGGGSRELVGCFWRQVWFDAYYVRRLAVGDRESHCAWRRETLQRVGGRRCCCYRSRPWMVGLRGSIRIAGPWRRGRWSYGRDPSGEGLWARWSKNIGACDGKYAMRMRCLRTRAVTVWV